MRHTTLGLVLVAFSSAAATGQPSADWAILKGQVTLPADLAIPARKPVGKAKGVLDETVIVSPKTRGIKNVVVWLRPNVANLMTGFAANEIHPGDAKRKASDVTIELEADRAEPRVAVARIGDTIVVKNTSAVAHKFHWSSTNNGEFDFDVASGFRERFTLPLRADSTPANFRCNIRPWVKGFARVFDHPYYAVTDEDGKFEIKSAPAGNYRIVFWHENVGFLGGKEGRSGREIRIAAGRNGVTVLDPTPFDVTK